MALLTYAWSPPDPTIAASAYLGGLRAGQAARAAQMQAMQNMQRNALEAQQEARLKEQFQQNMALQLMQENRLERAEGTRQNFLKLKQDRAAADAAEAASSDAALQRILGGGLPQSEPTADGMAQNLVSPGTATPAPTQAAATPSPDDAAPGSPGSITTSQTPGDLLITAANAADPAGNPAMSLAQPSPFALVNTPTPFPVDQPITPAQMLASASPFGGTPGPVVNDAPDDDGQVFVLDPVSGAPLEKATQQARAQAVSMPAGASQGEAVDNPLLAPMKGYTPAGKAGRAPSPAELLMALPPKARAQAVKQIAVRGLTGGDAAGKPIVRNMADGTTQQYDPATQTWQVLARKAEPQSIEDVTRGMTHNADRNTYQSPDGGEFFVSRSASGKVALSPFKPDSHPAKFLWGDDGNVYPHDNQGNPLKPVPEGVQLREHGKLQTFHVAGVGQVVVNPDQTTSVLVPEGVTLTAKQKEEYTADVSAGREALDKYAAAKKLLEEKPRSATSWFGGSQSAVDSAKAEVDKITKKISDWKEQYPQLNTQKANVQPTDEKVSVIAPDGRPGRIPRSQLDAALKQGYRQK